MSPAVEYRSRHDARTRTHQRLLRADARLSHARLAVFGGGLLLGWLAWQGAISPWWLAPAVVLFGWLVARHDAIARQRDAAARAIAFYDRALARVEDRWIGTGESGDRFRDDDHLYAADLDLFGKGSLFELLSIARTRAGEETLASWLKAPASPHVVRARQSAVEELASRLDLREAIALAGADVRAAVDTGALTAWAGKQPVLASRGVRVLAVLLSASAAGAAAWWGATGNAAPFAAAAAADILFSLPLRRRVQQVLHASEQPARDLDVLAHLLTRIESERFSSSRLVDLSLALCDRTGPPAVSTPAAGRAPAASATIRRLHRLSDMHAWQHNQFFAPLAAALLWGTHLAFAIEAWRRAHGARVSAWLATVGEFEALSSLATYRYEHPNDVFPDLVEGAAAFDGVALGHPLIPAARMVRNDVHLGRDTQLIVISGSNMSGKSTLLRTVGINAVLAQMGAPVRASRLRLTPLAVGATLRIQDSLQEGRSRFFAEITRVRRLADASLGLAPLLFLLDELFHGTNSHDRLVGATGVLRSLLDRGAIGLVTTHDLALTRIAADVGPRAVNAHFEDTFEEGEIRFDYRMRPGPVTRSNALALMRAVGLSIE